jgi:hypothetical protein
VVAKELDWHLKQLLPSFGLLVTLHSPAVHTPQDFGPSMKRTQLTTCLDGELTGGQAAKDGALTAVCQPRPTTATNAAASLLFYQIPPLVLQQGLLSLP